jgi:hypothetical protein
MTTLGSIAESVRLSNFFAAIAMSKGFCTESSHMATDSEWGVMHREGFRRIESVCRFGTLESSLPSVGIRRTSATGPGEVEDDLVQEIY